MSYLVRASKFRHVFGDVKSNSEGYGPGIKAQNTTPESHLIKGNTKFWGVSWAAGGGGALAVIPNEKLGRFTGKVPHLGGHKAPVLDFDFCPFDEYQVATGSEDTTVNVWQIPEGGLTDHLHEPIVSLTGHQKKVHIVNYHPTADGILTTASHDHTIKVWDIAQAKELFSFDNVFSEIIWSVSWNKQGSQFCTTNKDKQCRILDPRADASVVSTFQAHQGGKPQKCIWTSNKAENIITLGFNKQSNREVALWDPRNLETAVKSIDIGQGAGMAMGMFDEDTNMLYLGAKGDTSIKYFEVIDEAPHIFELSSYSSTKPHKGVCMLPKMACNIMQCEVARVLRLCNDSVEVVPFKVPRKSQEFQDDLFPNTRAPIAPMTTEEWVGGKNSDPKMMSARPGEATSAAPRKTMKTVFQLQKECDEKDAKIAELEAKIKQLQA